MQINNQIMPEMQTNLPLPQRDNKVVTPIKVIKYSPLVKGFHHDKYLIEGFSNGFRLGYTGPRQFCSSENSKTALECFEITNTKLNKEIQSGRIVGPFGNPPFKNLQISPLGIVPKKVPGQFRMIHNLSFPKGSLINHFICPELSTVQYTRFDDATALLLKVGPKALMAKTDIDSAFRIIPIHPLDHDLLGTCWRNKFYFDKCLAMGASMCNFRAF